MDIGSAPIDPFQSYVEFRSAPIAIGASVKVALFEYILNVLIHLTNLSYLSTFTDQVHKNGMTADPRQNEAKMPLLKSNGIHTWILHLKLTQIGVTGSKREKISST